MTETKAKRPRPNTPKQPMDHLKPAAQREAEGDETVTVTYGGKDFEMPADQDDWPILAVQAFANQRQIDAIEHLLGPQQWATFVTFFPTRRHFNALAEQIAEAFGFKSPGESQPSTD